MKRLIAAFIFLLGGISFELSKPVNCSMVHTRQTLRKRSTP